MERVRVAYKDLDHGVGIIAYSDVNGIATPSSMAAARDGQPSAQINGPPYPPRFQSLGEVPSILPDVPVNVVFLCLFLGAGLGHFLLLLRNQHNGKKFFISIMVGIFCLTRVIATSLRIAWACNPTDLHVAITATVFVYAGIVLLYLANLFFAQRIVRAQHPPFGWSKPFTILLPALFVITIGTVLCLIAAVVAKFYTRDSFSRNAAREIQKFGSTMLAIIAFLPLLTVGISSLARRHPTIRKTKTTDKFGEGSMRAKIAICLISSALLCLGAAFRAATTLKDPVPITLHSTNSPEPAPIPWYLSKACFYIFNFTLEILVVLLWLDLRVDKRFYIPDGASGPFSYAGGFVFAGEFGNSNDKRRSNNPNLPISEQELARGSFRLSMSRQQSRERSTSEQRSSRRMSWGSNKVAQQEKIASRVSWGGVSREDVSTGLGEDKGEMPYAAFQSSGRYGEDPSDIGIEGVEKEMGWDPKSGKWAVRPISTASMGQQDSGHTRITSDEYRQSFRESVASGWVDVDDT